MGICINEVAQGGAGDMRSIARTIAVQTGVAVSYLLLARVVHGYFTSTIASVFWPPGGLALAVLLVCGKRYAWGVFFGALLTHIIADHSIWTPALIALGNTLEALAGAWLLKRNRKFDVNLRTLHDYTGLIFWGGCVAGLVGTAVGPLVLLVAGIFTPDTYLLQALHWWMGDVLGVVLVAPLILVWREFPSDWLDYKRLPEIALLFGLAFLVGQVVFMGWLPDTLGLYAQHFWMFLFVAWAAVRLGAHGVLLLLALIASQALFGAYSHTGLFADDLVRTQLVNFWLYVVTLSVVGMMLASYISAETLSKQAIGRQEAFFHLISDNIDDFITVLDLQGRRIYSCPAYDKLFGQVALSDKLDCFVAIHPDDREHVRAVFDEVVKTGIGQRVEFRFVLPDGSLREMESRCGVIRDAEGKSLEVVVVSHDISNRKQAEMEIRNLAFYDALTALPNRRLLEDRLAQAMLASKRNDSFGAVIFLDLNNFKPLNDTYGHGLGDALLVEVAQRLNHCVRKVDTVARYGGDEFVAVLSELGENKAKAMRETLSVAEKMQAALAVIYSLQYADDEGQQVAVEHHCGASVGCILFTGREASQEVLLKWADMAMYQAKKKGGQHICFPENCEDVTQSGRFSVPVFY